MNGKMTFIVWGIITPFIIITSLIYEQIIIGYIFMLWFISIMMMIAGK